MEEVEVFQRKTMRMSLSSGPCGSPFSNFIYFIAKIVIHGVEDSDGFRVPRRRIPSELLKNQ